MTPVQPDQPEHTEPESAAHRHARHLPLLAAVLGLAGLGLAIPALVFALRADGDSHASAGATDETCPVTQIAEKVLPSVVTINVSTPAGGGTGSGEVIDGNGHILTNNHVISAAASGGAIRIVFSNGDSQDARLVGRDPQTDLAVLQVAHPQSLTPIRFGNSNDVQVGQGVVALGAPLGLSNTVTAGIISARDRSVNVPSDNGSTALLLAAIQTDAAINPGNSGGALVDCAGDLVGIPTAGASAPSESGGSSAGSIGLGFAIPSGPARDIANELISDGQVSRGTFGISVVQLAGADGPRLYVAGLAPGGPGAAAGLQESDTIVSVNGQAASAEQLLVITLTHKPGDSVLLTYERAGARHDATLVLGAR